MGQPTDGVGAVKASPPCPVCGQPLDEGTRVDCTTCGTPHHRDCWRFKRGCAASGCSSVTYVADVAAPAATSPSSSSSSSPPLSVSRPLFADPRAARRLALALGVLILVAAGLLRVAPAVGALPVFLAMMLSGSIRQARYVFEVDPVGRVLRRSLLYGRHRLTRGDAPLAHLDDVVEIHRHDFKDRRGSRVQQVWLALDTGERILLAQLSGYAKPPSGELAPDLLAERLAKLTSGAVRLIEGPDGPSRAEIRSVANERLSMDDPDERAPR